MALPALLSTDDLVKFRTRFCERFLQFGECNFGGKCQYSHNMTWRRRSPQKYLYEPRLCDNIVWFITESGMRRQTISNCHNGKNCKFAHSREEILYHPLIYKTVMCEDITCGKFYCPFAHAMEELLQAAEAPEYIRRCLMDAASLDESDSDLLDDGDCGPAGGIAADGEITILDGSLRLRKASGVGGPAAPRLHLPVPGSAEWNAQTDPSAWIAISPAIRIETVIRARSPVVSSELCRALVSRTDTAGLAAKKITPSGIPSQYCIAKVIQVPCGSGGAAQLIQELQTISKTEHRNLVTVKRVHVGAMPNSQQMVCLALEQASTSLAQAVVDGYRQDGSVRGLARKLATSPMAASQRISDLVAGLQRLHFIGSAHGRICPTNILIDAESGFKISDFMGKLGLLQAIIDGNFEAGKQYLEEPQSIVWLAPELTRFLTLGGGGPKAPTPDLKKSDVFSLGCVVFYAMTGQHPFGSTSDGIAENIQADYITNQHLLYNCPLVLDLCLRCLVTEPSRRIDLTEMSRHPLFWDFDMTRTALAGAASGGGAEFLDYELKWKEVVSGWISAQHYEALTVLNFNIYPDSIIGVVRFLVESWSSVNQLGAALLSSLLVKTLDAFPQILVRVWDSQHVGSTMSVFKRNHLHWMSLRNSATTCVSHHFVREYYDALSGADSSLPDESDNLSDACNAQAAGIAGKLKSSPKPAMVPLRQPKASFRPPAPQLQSSPILTPSPVAGMTFVDPMVVKQMAAASAALSAIYDNPELVSAITKGEPTPYNQLIATASIYSSLLEEAGATRPQW